MAKLRRVSQISQVYRINIIIIAVVENILHNEWKKKIKNAAVVKIVMTNRTAANAFGHVLHLHTALIAANTQRAPAPKPIRHIYHTRKRK